MRQDLTDRVDTILQNIGIPQAARELVFELYGYAKEVEHERSDLKKERADLLEERNEINAERARLTKLLDDKAEVS